MKIFRCLTHHVIKDISLMHVDRDERLEFSSLDFSEISCGLVDECVKQLQEALVGLLHHFSVVLGVL